MGFGRETDWSGRYRRLRRYDALPAFRRTAAQSRQTGARQLVFQYLLPTSLLFPIDGDAKHPRFLPQLDANGDQHWDALIGRVHWRRRPGPAV